MDFVKYLMSHDSCLMSFELILILISLLLSLYLISCSLCPQSPKSFVSPFIKESLVCHLLSLHCTNVKVVTDKVFLVILKQTTMSNYQRYYRQ